MVYTYQWRIRSGDTDFSGLVYTPEVIDCMVVAVQEMLEEVGYPHTTAMDEGIQYPAVRAEADYLGAITIDDLVSVEITPDVGTTSVTFRAVGTVSEVAFEGSVTLVFVDADSGEPVEVPAAVSEKLKAYV